MTWRRRLEFCNILPQSKLAFNQWTFYPGKAMHYPLLICLCLSTPSDSRELEVILTTRLSFYLVSGWVSRSGRASFRDHWHFKIQSQLLLDFINGPLHFSNWLELSYQCGPYQVDLWCYLLCWWGFYLNLGLTLIRWLVNLQMALHNDLELSDINHRGNQRNAFGFFGCFMFRRLNNICLQLLFGN
jgi:hypothetical protein